MTYLPALVTGFWFHLYLILDLYSRKIVGWEVHDTDDSDHAVHLVRRTEVVERVVVHRHAAADPAVRVVLQGQSRHFAPAAQVRATSSVAKPLAGNSGRYLAVRNSDSA